MFHPGNGLKMVYSGMLLCAGWGWMFPMEGHAQESRRGLIQSLVRSLVEPTQQPEPEFPYQPTPQTGYVPPADPSAYRPIPQYESRYQAPPRQQAPSEGYDEYGLYRRPPAHSGPQPEYRYESRRPYESRPVTPPYREEYQYRNYGPGGQESGYREIPVRPVYPSVPRQPAEIAGVSVQRICTAAQKVQQLVDHALSDMQRFGRFRASRSVISLLVEIRNQAAQVDALAHGHGGPGLRHELKRSLERLEHLSDKLTDATDDFVDEVEDHAEHLEDFAEHIHDVAEDIEDLTDDMLDWVD
ncbi:Hypothetical protein PBC10988_22250 [Planctomycetales bacterium 10988]|nr:Hypothetical protein PBC10988_22250 [Planctomycetales bacterium 10988]